MTFAGYAAYMEGRGGTSDGAILALSTAANEVPSRLPPSSAVQQTQSSFKEIDLVHESL